MEDVFTIQKQIETVTQGFRHVVILGAGASKALCLDNPEKNGKKIPLMNDLPKIIDLQNELSDLNNDLINENFETIFSTLYNNNPKSLKLKKIEEKIYSYFQGLELPQSPTIYDYLVLSLRNKDLIATFNWDPFLWQAYKRNKEFTSDLPNILFLHGNVAIGICEASKTFGPNGFISLKSGKMYEPTKLLYPVENKDYTNNKFIKSQWDGLSHCLKNTARLTIFGYSAPVSDVEAIKIMRKAWGKPEVNKIFTQVEIIDIQNRDALTESWKDFIYSHHFEITDNFYDSSILRFPRRTGEVFQANYLEAKWYEENYPPKFKTLEQLWEWYKPLISAERSKT